MAAQKALWLHIFGLRSQDRNGASSNLTDNCVAGEFVPPLLLPRQNKKKEVAKGGRFGGCLIYINDQKSADYQPSLIK